MNITEESLERLVVGLFGEGLTEGRIFTVNDADEEFASRDIDEIINFSPTYISLLTEADELVGFALPTENVPKYFPVPSTSCDGLKIWFFDKPLTSAFLADNDIVEIPLVDYVIDENNFYGEEDFFEPEEQQVESVSAKLDAAKNVTFAMSPSAKRDSGWTNQSGTVQNFVEMLLLHQEGKKDGACFLQGELAGDRRLAKAMIRNHFVIFDLDTGETAEEVDQRLEKTGYAYVRYTTHSHMTDVSEINRTAFFKWSGMDAEKNIDKNSLRRYLIEVKGFIPRVTEILEILEDAKVTEDGTTTIIRHSPMPKHRIVFFLNEPFVFQGKTNQQDAIRAWKEHYHGFGIDLGFVYDKTCIDPGRLFYLPRHGKGNPYDTKFVDGDPVDLRSYNRVAMRDSVVMNNSGANAFAEAAKALGATSEGMFVDGVNLKRWIMTHDCEIIDLIEAHYPDAIKTPRTNGPGYHIECPFEDEHSKAGGLGTYAINASDTDNNFHVHCTHDACQGRNKLDYVKRMVELDWFEAASLQDETFCPSVVREQLEQDAEKGEEESSKGEVDINALIESLSEKSKKDDVVDIMRKIGRQPDVDEDDFEDYLTRIARKTKISKKNLKKNAPAAFAKDSLKAQEELDEMDRQLHEYNERYAMVDTGSKVVIMDNTKADMSFTNRDDWKALKANEKMMVNQGQGESRMESIAKVWMEWSQRRTFTGVAFDPRPNPDKNKMNLFKGFEKAARKGDWSLLQKHIFNIVCHRNEYEYNWLMTWMAHIFQRPWEKKGSAIVVRGTKGAGKSIVFNQLKDALGKYAMSSANSSHITGNFNWHFRDKLLLIAEEGLFAGDARDDSVLKDLITGSTLTMEPKGIDAFEMDNFTRIIIISNEDWVVNATPDERRYYITEVSSEKTGDIEYFEAISDQMKAGGLEAMIYDLMNYEPPFEEKWNILRRPPMTSALAKQVTRSIHPAEKFFTSLVENMGVSEAGSEIEPIELNYNEPTMVSADELRHYYYNSLTTNSGRYKKNPEAFKEYVKKFFPEVKYVKTKGNTYGGSALMLKIPPLVDVIHHIEHKLNISLDIIEFEQE